MPTLSANNLVKTYKSRTVVDDVSFDVSSGEVVGLLGPNGAGKTTSFYMVVGLVQADKGSIKLDEQDITQLPMHARAQQGMGYLPQEASVFRKLSVEDNILAVLEAQKQLNRQQRKEKLDALINDLQIDHIRQNIGMGLSGGERRRVEIARALASQPAFVLLDEPFAGVDPISVIEIQKIVKHLIERKIGVLITDHNVRETLGICNRAYILNGGKIIAKGKPEEILSNEEVREVYLGRDFRL
ncbi:Lipopolysaccharide ABC transporter, ATP-binding protein LptB [hydrothermal vent metagenome]|uniref:Lipopolysaccharide export system ATP-binding protein LptB n=1 Tax=hydrothermal vent metagenome TaxID=652676 RepID=A0A3B0WN99_9ZZZZ